jgi:RNA polymerase-binding transcription factor DksA
LLTPPHIQVKWPPFLERLKGNSNMADEIDLANDLIDSEVSRALSRIRQNASKQAVGAKFCIECGDEMPTAREQLGFKYCVPCAEERERRKSLYADE